MLFINTERKKIVIFEEICPICEQRSNLLLTRDIETIMFCLVIWLWSGGDYIITCGCCHNSFKIEKSVAYEILDYFFLPHEQFILKNILSLSVVIGIMFIICLIAGLVSS